MAKVAFFLTANLLNFHGIAHGESDEFHVTSFSKMIAKIPISGTAKIRHLVLRGATVSTIEAHQSIYRKICVRK